MNLAVVARGAVLAVLVGLAVVPAAPAAPTPAATALAPAASSGGPVATRVAAAPASVTPARLHRRVRFGAYVDGMTAEPGRFESFERLLRRRMDVASHYWGYGDHFPGALERRLADGGRRDVLVSWDMGPHRFTSWTAGEHDAYLDVIADLARAYPHELYVRPWPEMNGDWQSFQPTPSGDRPHGGTYAEFVAAWRYVVDHLRARGATNLRWVFNPTVDTYAETTPVERIWPGRSYVDVLGIDGFNWGRDAGWGRWRSFVAIFRPMYRRLTALHPTAPVWICEVGSKEPRREDGAPRDARRSKARWMRAALRTRAFPRLTTMVWFQARKERDWRVQSSPEALRVARRLLRAP